MSSLCLTLCLRMVKCIISGYWEIFDGLYSSRTIVNTWDGAALVLKWREEDRVDGS